MERLVHTLTAAVLLNVALAHVAQPNKMVEIVELMLSPKHHNSSLIHRVPQAETADYDVFITQSKASPEVQGTQKIKIFVDAESMMSQESKTLSFAVKKEQEKLVPVLPLSIETAGINIDEYQQTKINNGKVSEQSVPNKRQAVTTQKPKPTTRRTTRMMEMEKPKPMHNKFGLGSTVVLTVKEDTPLSLSREPSYVDQNNPYKNTPKDDDAIVEEYTRLVLGQLTPASSSYNEEERVTTSQPKYQSYESTRRGEEIYNPVDNTDYNRYPESSPYDEPVAEVSRPSQHDYDDNRRPVRQKPPVYTGFPESHSQSGTAQSRPLQNDGGRAFPASPCHQVFQYEGREPASDRWYGNIYVTTDELLIGMRLGIVLDRPADLLATWLYEVKSKDNIQFNILELNKRLLPGPAETVRIMVKFDKNGPIPYLSSITLNGRRVCPKASFGSNRETTRRPVYEEQQTRRTTPEYYSEYEPATRRTTPPDRRTTTENYYEQDNKRTTPRPTARPLNPSKVEETGTTKRRVPVTSKPATTKATYRPPTNTTSPSSKLTCGKALEQPNPLITKGQQTKRGQWPWHIALYRIKGADLVYACGGSLISMRHVVTAAHCVTKTYDTKPLEAENLVVHLGKYHLKWTEGVQTNQVSEVYVHPQYNSTDFKADLAVLELATPVQFTNYVRPVCLWDKRNTRIEDLWGKDGTVIGWGYDEHKTLTESLMQAKMPVVKHEDCLYSYPQFFGQFTSNLTYCAGSRDGVSVCNGDSGGGMVFPFGSVDDVTWHLRGIVSISVSKEDKVCDPRHYIVFTDIAKFLPWLESFL